MEKTQEKASYKESIVVNFINRTGGTTGIYKI